MGEERGGRGGIGEACTHREHSLGLAASAHVGVVDVLEHHPGLVVFARLEGEASKEEKLSPPKNPVNISSQICKMKQRKHERFFFFFFLFPHLPSFSVPNDTFSRH